MSGVTGKVLTAVLLASFLHPGMSMAAEDSWHARLWHKITRQKIVHKEPAPVPTQKKVSLAVPIKASAQTAPKPGLKPAPAALMKKNAVTAADRDDAPEPPLSDEARRLLETPARKIKGYGQSSGALTVDDSSPQMHTLTSDGYSGPDMSEERAPMDEQLHRKFPMPQPPPVQQPVKNPPTIQQYAPPPQPPRRSDES